MELTIMVREKSNSFLQLLDLIVDRIVAFSDYFIVERHVSLSEAMLFTFASVTTGWMMLMTMGKSTLRDAAVFVFAALVVAHMVGFAFKSFNIRAYVAAGYAFIWWCLTLIAVRSGLSHQLTDPIFPAYAILTLKSIIISVRLFREARTT